MSHPKLSIVIPVFNEEETLLHTHSRIVNAMSRDKQLGLQTVEIIYVDDGSKDKTPSILNQIIQTPANSTLTIQTKALSFSRNFGHSAAVMAGLQVATGTHVAIMDADLQDPPEHLPEMYKKLTSENLDVVFGQRSSREGEGPFKRFTAWLFYRLLRSITGVDIPKDTGDFRVITKQVRDAVISCEEGEPFLRGLIAWVGFKQAPFLYIRKERAYGKTKYTIKKMFKFATQALLSFSSAPLLIAFWIGLLGIIFSALLGGWALYVHLSGKAVSGWASLLLGFAIGQSLTLVLLGVIGSYLSRIHMEVMKRPKFIIKSQKESV